MKWLYILRNEEHNGHCRSEQITFYDKAEMSQQRGIDRGNDTVTCNRLDNQAQVTR